MKSASFDLVGQNATGIVIDDQLSFKGRNRPLMAGSAFADPTGNADGFKGFGFVQLKRIGVDQGICMLDLAPQGDGEPTHRRMI